MKALLDGGPAEGVVMTNAEIRDEPIWMIYVVHVNCACEWCAEVDGAAVEHVYERRDDDLYVYYSSRGSSWGR